MKNKDIIAEKDDEIRRLNDKVTHLNIALINADKAEKWLRKELDEANEKYATLLRKHIDMMERCVGIIPKIRRPEE